jgi:hypothetical protein
MPADGAEVTEIDVLALSRRKIGAIATPRVPRPSLPPPPPAPGYRFVERRDGEHHTLFRYRSARPALVLPDRLGSSRIDTVSPEVLFQPSHTG